MRDYSIPTKSSSTAKRKLRLFLKAWIFVIFQILLSKNYLIRALLDRSEKHFQFCLLSFLSEIFLLLLKIEKKKYFKMHVKRIGFFPLLIPQVIWQRHRVHFCQHNLMQSIIQLHNIHANFSVILGFLKSIISVPLKAQIFVNARAENLR